MGKDLTAPAADGHPLAVRRFPAQGTPWATMLLAGAMGVRQDFYAELAEFFAAHGVHVLTFDYRDSGYSRRGKLSESRASVTDWALKDLDAMIAEARRAAPHLPLAYVGHSLGGQLLPVLPHNGEVAAAIAVTTGSGYYRLNDRMPLRVRILWFLAIPLLTALFGYFPGRRLRMVGDLPREVARQWRRWCLHPLYLLSEDAFRDAFHGFGVPLLSYSFEDDELNPPKAIDSFHSFYPRGQVQRRHIAPADVGARRIGHFGFFAPASRDLLWTEALEWLRANAPNDRHPRTLPASIPVPAGGG